MNRLFVRDLVLVACAIAAITAFALALSTRKFVEHRSTAPPVAATAPPSARLGAKVYQAKCSSCHTTDGTTRIGPTFLHDFGSDVHLDDGRVIAMTEDYIRESLANPRAKARPGYPPTMPSFDGILNDREISALVAYLRSLQ